MNVQEVIDAVIKDSADGVKLKKTSDRLLFGDPNTKVKGIVTTFMATIDVIKQAVGVGANLIITHEPTFYTGKDTLEWLQDDPLYTAKKKLIEENDLAIWRYHDYMHMAKPDRIYEGLIKELGWENNLLEKESPFSYQINQTTLRELASFFKKRLAMDVIQIVGNPDMVCARVGILVGGGSLGLGREQMPMELMQSKDLDVIVCGEITEWTLTAYVNDARMLGMNKGMIVIGHERSEEWGMKYMAEWLRPLVSGVPVTFLDTKEPFYYL
ncbi:Nif3-like dinuclear metal center hexameric protein [Caldifermentibacillus hisashii]|uniref:GTP cyclohydrolase 1 type 2 homolog n=1 Tax=Caldifermentibacillus hisashii TaxID=996558 RepID=A0ABU9JTL4_9BACI